MRSFSSRARRYCRRRAYREFKKVYIGHSKSTYTSNYTYKEPNKNDMMIGFFALIGILLFILWFSTQ